MNTGRHNRNTVRHSLEEMEDVIWESYQRETRNSTVVITVFEMIAQRKLLKGRLSCSVRYSLRRFTLPRHTKGRHLGELESMKHRSNNNCVTMEVI